MGKKVEGFVYVRFSIYLKDDTITELELPVDARAQLEVEHNYGADADGNRGRDVYSYEDVEVEEDDIYDAIHRYIDVSLDWDNIVTFTVDSVEETSFQENE